MPHDPAKSIRKAKAYIHIQVSNDQYKNILLYTTRCPPQKVGFTTCNSGSKSHFFWDNCIKVTCVWVKVIFMPKIGPIFWSNLKEF